MLLKPSKQTVIVESSVHSSMPFSLPFVEVLGPLVDGDLWPILHGAELVLTSIQLTAGGESVHLVHCLQDHSIVRVSPPRNYVFIVWETMNSTRLHNIIGDPDVDHETHGKAAESEGSSATTWTHSETRNIAFLLYY